MSSDATAAPCPLCLSAFAIRPTTRGLAAHTHAQRVSELLLG